MMIVIDTDPKRVPENNATGQGSSFMSTNTAASPNAGQSSYGFSYNAPPPPPPPPSYYSYPSYSYQTTVIPAVVAVEYRQSPGARFCKAFAAAILVYFLVVGAVHTTANMAFDGIRWDDSVGAPRADDGTVLRSVGGSNWTFYHQNPSWSSRFPRSAEASFVLPVDSDELFLISRGSYQSGKVEVKQAPDVEQGSVKVDVRVAYHVDRALARATVCELQKDGDRNGVGIFTPSPIRWINFNKQDELYFQVTYTFPAARAGRTPVHVKGFKTSTGNYVYEIGDLWRAMMFDDIDVTTSNSHIQVESITFKRGSFASSNSHIRGHFNTSNSLTLRTSNGHIEATASLFNDLGLATTLVMTTSNSHITSAVALDTHSGTGGLFDVKAHSSNGRVSLEYEDSPLDARLTSRVTTSNSQASVKMHPAFEGSFEVTSSNIGPALIQNRVSDPSGKGRERFVKQNRSGNRISGSVYWAERSGARKDIKGSSSVQTSNSRASLEL
ncbi:hypothetical protein HYDPIDRAFT_118152 [Hydnomerulius pinastri MD-312]|uniref:Uncharacterized protein n=1 Tax=Hydnomerulius pinastri MD-312 TaxID=994086 RepID=A0A0C9VQ18_9AGAM|nr:hypothetical protein HYDPIDRAFT_118152 [Hydnomerulius pinastri MD-312]